MTWKGESDVRVSSEVHVVDPLEHRSDGPSNRTLKHMGRAVEEVSITQLPQKNGDGPSSSAIQYGQHRVFHILTHFLGSCKKNCFVFRQMRNVALLTYIHILQIHLDCRMPVRVWAHEVCNVTICI